MKRLGQIVAMPLVGIALLLAALPAAGQGVAQWHDTEHDFGIIGERERWASHDFVVENTGDDALLIVRVKTTCGCTVANYPQEPIMPGQTAKVNVKYTSTGRPGPFSKSVFVYTNEKPSATRLVVKGIMAGNAETTKRYFPVDASPLMLTRPLVPLGEIKKGELGNGHIEVFNAGSDTVAVSLDSFSEHVNAMIAPDTIPPYETATISLFFNSLKYERWGWAEDSIVMNQSPLHSNDKPKATQLKLSATVIDDFKGLTPEQLNKAPIALLSTNTLDFATLPPSGFSQIELKIKNAGKSTLEIRGLKAHHEALTIKDAPKSVKPGKEATVVVRVDVDKAGEILNSFITMQTNDPLHPTQQVKTVGLKSKATVKEPNK